MTDVVGLVALAVALTVWIVRWRGDERVTRRTTWEADRDGVIWPRRAGR